jgi:hypothetical protein
MAVGNAVTAASSNVAADTASKIVKSTTENNKQKKQSNISSSDSKKKSKRKKKNKKKKTANDDEEDGEGEETSSEIIKAIEGNENVSLGEGGSSSTSNEKEKTTIGDNKEEEENDDDDELLAAAAMWAGDEDGDITSNIQSSSEKDNRKNDSSISLKTTETTLPAPPFQRKQVYSLHITQLPYDSTEFDLRKLFAEHGCSITSIRLVYDRDTQGNKTVFRGVAFIDMYDSNSYEVALRLHHRTSIRGRKLNVRPCRSKEELAEIVERTKELVTEKIRHQRMLERGGGDDGGVASSSNKTDKKTGNNNKNKRKDDDRKGRRTNEEGGNTKLDADGKPIKLTKKERNKRAAIIMMRKRQKR